MQMRRIVLSFIAVISLLIGILSMTGIAKADTYDQLAMAENVNWVMTSTTSALDGDTVFIYQSFDNTNQEFALAPYTVGGPYYLEYHILNANTGQTMCLTGDTTKGHSVFLEPCTTTNPNSELWTPIDTGGSNIWKNVNSGWVIALNGNNLVDYGEMINWSFVNFANYEELVFLGSL